MILAIADGLLEVLVAPLWAAVVVFIAIGVAWVLRRPLKRVARDLGVTKVSLLGVDIEWITEQVQSAYRAKGIDGPAAGDLRSFAVLSAHLAQLLLHRRVLWVDDAPRNNLVETRLLRSLGVDVENALTTQEALGRLETNPARFDLVISDWTRDGREEGPELLEQLRADRQGVPVIFYVGAASPERRSRGAELGAVAVTQLPDELLKFALVELSTAR